jgi:hypothetical protein
MARKFEGMRRPLGGFFSDPHPRDVERERTQRDEQLAEDVRGIRFFIGALYRRTENIMRSLDDVLGIVTTQRGQIASLAALTAGIKKKLDEALGGELTPSQQMRVDAIFNEVQAGSKEIVDAINANDGDPNTPPIDIIPTKTTVTSSNAQVNVGEPVTFSAGVEKHPDAPADKVLTGTVSFMVDGTEVGSATVADGVAVAAPISTLAAGEHQVTAVYSGDASFEKSVSDAIVQTVVAAAPPA